jgi:hypothetical protein
MRTYSVAAIMTLAIKSFAWPQTARNSLAELAEQFDPALVVVGTMLRVDRAPIVECGSAAWSMASADRAVHA